MKKTFKGKDFKAIFTDENGYFSFTGDFGGGSGAVGDKIAEQHPEFEPLAAMHLSLTTTGAPMHGWSAIDYFFKKGDRAAFDKTIRHRADEYWDALLSRDSDRIKDIREEIEDLWLWDKEELLEIVEDIPSNISGWYINPMDDAGGIMPDYADIDSDDLPRMDALAQHLDCDINDIWQPIYGDNIFAAEGSDWWVLTDNEADEAWEEELDNYLDECVLPELPDNLQNYFNRDAWKWDARVDGRGHSLNRYDGNEYDEISNVDHVTYYIYRQ